MKESVKVKKVCVCIILWGTYWPPVYSSNEFLECMNQVEMEYEQCKAQCEYDVDKGNQDYSESSWGNLNNSINSYTEEAIRQGVKDGRIRESQYDRYQNTNKILNATARGLMIGKCNSRCTDRRRDDESFCQ